MSEAVAEREDALREALRTQEQIYRLTAKINRAADPQDIFAEALDALETTAGVQRASILLLEGAAMRFKAWRGLSDEYRAAVEGHSPWPADATDPHPILVPDVRTAPELEPLRGAIAQEGIRSLAFVPIAYNRRLIGKFMLYKDVIHVYTPEEINLVETIAGNVAAGIERHRTAERVARAERGQRFLAEASSVLSASLDYEATLRRIARLSVPALADWCLIHIVEHGTVRHLEAAHTDRQVEERLKAFAAGVPLDPNNPTGPTMFAIKTQRTLLIPEVTEAYLRTVTKEERVVRFAMDLGVRSFLAVPLIARGETLGAILFATSTLNRNFDAEDVELAEELGRRAALAVDNARLFEQQRTVAETLQHSLLPSPLPDFYGVQLATRYIPGGRGVDVGGDWYDVFDLANGQIGMVIGDVVGRGIEAAALMGQARNALRAYAFDAAAPHLVVERLNALLVRDHHATMVTLLYVVFDPSTRMLRLVSAGHLPPLLIEPDAAPRYVEGGRGLPLGVAPRASYSESTISLSPGATVLLYTDGLVDRRTESLDAAMDRLLTVASETYDNNAEAMLDRILSSMLDSSAEDDVAVVAFRPLHVGNDALNLRLPARPEVLARARHTLRQWFDEKHIPRETASEIIVAVGEAAANVVTHAYGAAEGEIDIQMTAAAGEISVMVRDFGRWRSSPGGGGLGCAMMRAFMDSVEIQHHETGTVVRMRKQLSVLHVD
jgi:serine phosphatase RsbU (regulator of sigma subunit)/anti-sigma regulatory factor (Ser/Thr protein kinase)